MKDKENIFNKLKALTGAELKAFLDKLDRIDAVQTPAPVRYLPRIPQNVLMAPPTFVSGKPKKKSGPK